MLPIHRPTVTTCFWLLVLGSCLFLECLYPYLCPKAEMFGQGSICMGTYHQNDSSISRHLYCGVTGTVPYNSQLMAPECPFDSTHSPQGIPRIETAREWGDWVKLKPPLRDSQESWWCRVARSISHFQTAWICWHYSTKFLKLYQDSIEAHGASWIPGTSDISATNWPCHFGRLL